MLYENEPGRPYTAVFDLPPNAAILGETKITSVIMDEDEFMRVVDQIQQNPLSRVPPAEWAGHVQAMREAKHIPAVGRGEKTAWIFDRFHVTTKVMCLMVRGQGMELARKMGILG